MTILLYFKVHFHYFKVYFQSESLKFIMKYEHVYSSRDGSFTTGFRESFGVMVEALMLFFYFE